MTRFEEDGELVPLVLRARSGDTEAFSTLVRHYYGRVYAVAYARLGHRESAEELVQEVFLRAYLRMDTLREAAFFSTWLVRITRNLALDWLTSSMRSARLVTLVHLEEIAEEQLSGVASPTPRDQAAQTEQQHQLAKALGQLEPEPREAVMLHYFEGLSKIAIASLLGVHPTTVGRQLDRALNQLKTALGAAEVSAQVEAMGATMRPSSSRALASTCAAVVALAALSPEARAALAARVHDTPLASPASQSPGRSATSSAKPDASSVPGQTLLHRLLPTLSSGEFIMNTPAAVAVTLSALLVLGTGGYRYAFGQKAAPPAPKSQTATASSARSRPHGNQAYPAAPHASEAARAPRPAEQSSIRVIPQAPDHGLPPVYVFRVKEYTTTWTQEQRSSTSTARLTSGFSRTPRSGPQAPLPRMHGPGNKQTFFLNIIFSNEAETVWLYEHIGLDKPTIRQLLDIYREIWRLAWMVQQVDANQPDSQTAQQNLAIGELPAGSYDASRHEYVFRIGELAKVDRMLSGPAEGTSVSLLSHFDTVLSPALHSAGVSAEAAGDLRKQMAQAGQPGNPALKEAAARDNASRQQYILQIEELLKQHRKLLGAEGETSVALLLSGSTHEISFGGCNPADFDTILAPAFYSAGVSPNAVGQLRKVNDQLLEAAQTTGFLKSMVLRQELYLQQQSLTTRAQREAVERYLDQKGIRPAFRLKIVQSGQTSSTLSGPVPSQPQQN